MGQYLSSSSDADVTDPLTDTAMGIYYASVGDLSQVVDYVGVSSPMAMCTAAIDNEQIEVLRYLLNEYISEKERYQLLGYAIRLDKAKSVLCIVEKGVDLVEAIKYCRDRGSATMLEMMESLQDGEPSSV